MATDILLIRHGQSTFNAHFEATGTDPGHIDARLTELGHRQAAEARAEAARHPRPDLVLASPLTRAIQTALAIYGGTGIPLEVTCRHREHLTHTCDIGRSPAALAADFPGLDFAHLADPWWHTGPLDHRGLPEEPHEVFAARLADFAAYLADHPAGTIAVVGHGSFFRSLAGRPFANCEIVRWTPR